MAEDPIHQALSHDDQWARYHRQMQTYQAALDRWTADGKLGPRPPRPVRPHTPGFHAGFDPSPDFVDEAP